jgi:hypothetical protein
LRATGRREVVRRFSHNAGLLNRDLRASRHMGLRRKCSLLTSRGASSPLALANFAIPNFAIEGLGADDPLMTFIQQNRANTKSDKAIVPTKFGNRPPRFERGIDLAISVYRFSLAHGHPFRKILKPHRSRDCIILNTSDGQATLRQLVIGRTFFRF